MVNLTKVSSVSPIPSMSMPSMPICPNFEGKEMIRVIIDDLLNAGMTKDEVVEAYPSEETTVALKDIVSRMDDSVAKSLIDNVMRKFVDIDGYGAGHLDGSGEGYGNGYGEGRCDVHGHDGLLPLYYGDGLDEKELLKGDGDGDGNAYGDVDVQYAIDYFIGIVVDKDYSGGDGSGRGKSYGKGLDSGGGNGFGYCYGDVQYPGDGYGHGAGYIYAHSMPYRSDYWRDGDRLIDYKFTSRNTNPYDAERYDDKTVVYGGPYNIVYRYNYIGGDGGLFVPGHTSDDERYKFLW